MTASGTIRCSAPYCKSVAPIDFLLINHALHTTRIIPIYVWTGLWPDGGRLIEHTSSSETLGDFLFVFNDSRKISLRVTTLLNGLDELMEALETGNFIGISKLCRIESRREYGK